MVREVDEMAVGMLVVGKAGGLISGMRRQLESLLTFSSGDPLHLVVVVNHLVLEQAVSLLTPPQV